MREREGERERGKNDINWVFCNPKGQGLRGLTATTVRSEEFNDLYRETTGELEMVQGANNEDSYKQIDLTLGKEKETITNQWRIGEGNQ